MDVQYGMPRELPYFFLNHDCLLIGGAVHAALYDLGSGNVYSVDREAREILEQTERGVAVRDLHTTHGAGNEVRRFLAGLQEMGLGSFRPASAAPPKVTVPRPASILRKVWVELTERCNLRCVHCYADASPVKKTPTLEPRRWRAVIREAAELGARDIQFIGGEPLLYGKKRLLPLLAAARDAGYGVVEVFTNGTLLDEEWIDAFASSGVRVAVSIYSNEPRQHDLVTRRSGSFRRLRQNLARLESRGVPYRVGVVMMAQNRAGEADTLAWIDSSLAPCGVSCDVVRCTSGGRQRPQATLPPELWTRHLRRAAVFPKTPLEAFVRNRAGHPCWNGEICVQSDGRVYPCIMDRTHCLGDVNAAPLGEILDGTAVREVWGLSKDRTSVCRDCEFRYACFDCRPQASAVAQALGECAGDGLRAKDPCCLYDPYDGRWREAGGLLERLAARGMVAAESTDERRTTWEVMR